MPIVKIEVLYRWAELAPDTRGRVSRDMRAWYLEDGTRVTEDGDYETMLEAGWVRPQAAIDELAWLSGNASVLESRGWMLDIERGQLQSPIRTRPIELSRRLVHVLSLLMGRKETRKWVSLGELAERMAMRSEPKEGPSRLSQCDDMVRQINTVAGSEEGRHLGIEGPVRRRQAGDSVHYAFLG